MTLLLDRYLGLLQNKTSGAKMKDNFKRETETETSRKILPMVVRKVHKGDYHLLAKSLWSPTIK